MDQRDYDNQRVRLGRDQDIVTFHAHIDSPPFGTLTRDEPWNAEELSSEIQSQFAEAVRTRLGDEFQIRGIRLRFGSIDVEIILGVIGGLYGSVITYGAFRQGLDFLRSDLAWILAKVFATHSTYGIDVRVETHVLDLYGPLPTPAARAFDQRYLVVSNFILLLAVLTVLGVLLADRL